jgi:hypothetical protein
MEGTNSLLRACHACNILTTMCTFYPIPLQSHSAILVPTHLPTHPSVPYTSSRVDARRYFYNGERRFDCRCRVCVDCGSGGYSAWFMHTPTSQTHREEPTLLPEVAVDDLARCPTNSCTRTSKRAGLEFVRLLNNLEVGVDDMDGENWRAVQLVIDVLHSPVGQRLFILSLLALA